jgi:hypothetical protein
LKLFLRYGRRIIVKSKRTLSPRSFERRAKVHPAISFLIQVYYRIIWFKRNKNKIDIFMFYNYLLFFRYGRHTIVKRKRTLSPRLSERQAEVHPAISFLIHVFILLKNELNLFSFLFLIVFIVTNRLKWVQIRWMGLEPTMQLTTPLIKQIQE